ncbi:MAG: hypothetical protein FGM24_09935, partial [Candidatus Kapabacteria bacterium]|nr:hypothetical protein [Candidatus Kapabacteria bacterium]
MPHIDLPPGLYGIRGPMVVRPDASAALNELASVLLHDDHSLTAGEREYIATAVSRANSCEYCSNIHAAITAAHMGIGREDVLRAADTIDLLQPSDKLRELTTLALLVRNGGLEIMEQDVTRARAAGATDIEIHDAILIGSAFCMFNRYVDGLATTVPEEPTTYDEMGRNRAQQGYRAFMKALIVIVALFAPAMMLAQTGTLSGVIRFSDTKDAASYVRVYIDGKGSAVYSNRKGAFQVKNIPAGQHSVVLQGAEIQDTTIADVMIKSAETTSIDIEVERGVTTASEVVVYGASKRREKITESPSAITAVTPQQLQRLARGNQLGRALEGLNGVDIVQNGATDFNVNTRGFNNSTNRRLLVLVDGRDVSLQQIGAVEWNSFASALDDLQSIELVRGPAAALYGANAFNGVLNIRSLAPRDAQGTKISVLGGDYKTMRADVRHAGAFGDLTYKVTLGRSQSFNLAQNRTDSASVVSEYASLWPAARELNPLSREDRETFATYGTIRMDYDLSESKSVLAEFGYSQWGNEVMLAGAGRIHVPQSEKPFARIAYNDEHLNIQTTYNARRTIDTMRILAAPPGTIILDDSYDLNLDAQYNGNITDGLKYVVGGQYQYMSVGSERTVFPEEPIIARIGGVYGQIEADITKQLTFVGSARYDNANVYPQQFSPRLALKYSPASGHTFRVSAGRSFQRANFSELFRKYGFRPAFSAQGRPVNFRPIQTRINDTLSALTGATQDVMLNLFDPTVTSQMDPRGIQPAAWGVGNRDLNVEQNIGYELGYNGSLGKSLVYSVDFYYNRLT